MRNSGFSKVFKLKRQGLCSVFRDSTKKEPDKKNCTELIYFFIGIPGIPGDRARIVGPENAKFAVVTRGWFPRNTPVANKSVLADKNAGIVSFAAFIASTLVSFSQTNLVYGTE